VGEKQKQRNETNAVALPMASAQSLGENSHSAIIIRSLLVVRRHNFIH
jgi:hypothetical protein